MTGAYEVPRDFALVGFDDIIDAATPPYQLSTVAQPVHEMTDAVIRQLKAWIGSAKPPGTDVSQRIAPRLMVRRSSTRPGVEA